MNLAIDIGNTRIKAGIFENTKLQHYFNFQSIDELINNAPLKELLPYIKSAIISNVSDPALNNFIIAHTSINQLYELSNNLPLPFKINYETPHTLGSDRLAAVAGAIKEFSNENILIIDFGTCIKYNLVIHKTFEGGAISPGLEMRYKSLHYYTKKLPLLNPAYQNKLLIGKNTNDNLHSGIVNGCIAEVQFFIDKIIKEINDDIKIIITGGDANFFTELIERKVFLRPFIILHGLNEILQYQK